MNSTRAAGQADRPVERIANLPAHDLFEALATSTSWIGGRSCDTAPTSP